MPTRCREVGSRFDSIRFDSVSVSFGSVIRLRFEFLENPDGETPLTANRGPKGGGWRSHTYMGSVER